MTVILQIVVLAGLAGSAAFLGALLSYYDELRGSLINDRLRRGIVAFGGGALIGAAALVLVPHGLESQPLWLGALSFVAGGYIFLCIDRFLQRRQTPVSQLVALMLDFIPEAIVLGAVISGNFPMALFLTVIMATQNLPEGFNAYSEVRKSHDGFLRKHLLQIMALSIVIGPLAALAGFAVFEMDSLILGTIMTFCAGGILYLVFEDVAPAAASKGDWYPDFGAVLGFTVALVGYGLTG